MDPRVKTCKIYVGDNQILLHTIYASSGHSFREDFSKVVTHYKSMGAYASLGVAIWTPGHGCQDLCRGLRTLLCVVGFQVSERKAILYSIIML